MSEIFNERQQETIFEDNGAALAYVQEAFAEASLNGLDGDSVAHAALFAAFQELVAAYGEDAAADYAASLSDQIRTGAFTTSQWH